MAQCRCARYAEALCHGAARSYVARSRRAQWRCDRQRVEARCRAPAQTLPLSLVYAYAAAEPRRYDDAPPAILLPLLLFFFAAAAARAALLLRRYAADDAATPRVATFSLMIRR